MDEFTRDRYLIFEQATVFQLWSFGCDAVGRSVFFLIFGRRKRVLAPEGYEAGTDSLMWGAEIVAYPADENGYVCDWNHRYEAEGINFDMAINKIRYQRANLLATIHNYDDIT